MQIAKVALLTIWLQRLVALSNGIQCHYARDCSPFLYIGSNDECITPKAYFTCWIVLDKNIWQSTHFDLGTPHGVNTGSCDGFLPDVTKPLPIAVLTYHQWGTVADLVNCSQFCIVKLSCIVCYLTRCLWAHYSGVFIYLNDFYELHRTISVSVCSFSSLMQHTGIIKFLKHTDPVLEPEIEFWNTICLVLASK